MDPYRPVSRRRPGSAALFLATSALVLALLGWFGWQSLSRRAALRDATAALDQGKTDAAIAQLTPLFDPGAASDDPVRQMLVRARRKQAEACVARGEFAAADEALASAEKCLLPRSWDGIEITRQREALRLQHARALAAAGKPEEVVTLLLRNGQSKHIMEILLASRQFAAALRHVESRFTAGPEARAGFAAVAAAAAMAGAWTDAAAGYEKAQHFREAVEAFLKAGRADDALRVARAAGDADLLATVLETQGQWQEAARTLIERGKLERAAEIFSAHNDWARAAELLEQSGRYARAAELFEKSEQWTKAVAAWRRAGDDAKYRSALESVLRRCLAPEKAAQGVALLESIDRPQAASLVRKLRPELEANYSAAEFARCLILAGERADAARAYERAGRHRLAADLWRDLDDSRAELAALVQVARTEHDPVAALRAAELCHARRDPSESEMLAIAEKEALARRMARLLFNIYGQRHEGIQTAEKLLTLGESWVDAHADDANEALKAAAELLPRSTVVPAIKILFTRAEKLGTSIRAARLRQRRVELAVTNNYGGSQHEFLHSTAHFDVSNPLGALKSAVVVVELSEMESLNYDRAQRNALASRLAPGRGLGDSEFFTQRIPIGALAAQGSLPLDLTLENAIPYKFGRAWLENIEEAPPSGSP